ncbi:hypothetical protein, partial [Salmonella sp. SAL4357]|uniref:hypothetical protein n=1 Tax=Salmonella sp. SAL4357 TaxID=3159878 RepID=UPI00397E0FE9
SHPKPTVATAVDKIFAQPTIARMPEAYSYKVWHRRLFNFSLLALTVLAFCFNSRRESFQWIAAWALIPLGLLLLVSFITTSFWV